MAPVTARPISAQMKSCQPATEPPPVSASGVPKPMNQAMMMATPTIDSAPVTNSPLYSAFMMPLSGPSLTKYVPTIEVRMQIPPMPSGSISMWSRTSPVKKIAASSMVATMVTA